MAIVARRTWHPICPSKLSGAQGRAHLFDIPRSASSGSCRKRDLRRCGNFCTVRGSQVDGTVKTAPVPVKPACSLATSRRLRQYARLLAAEGSYILESRAKRHSTRKPNSILSSHNPRGKVAKSCDLDLPLNWGGAAIGPTWSWGRQHGVGLTQVFRSPILEPSPPAGLGGA